MTISEAPPAAGEVPSPKASGLTAGCRIQLLFVLSGICGLIYQVVWAKQLSYVLGSTSQATALVLAVFMGGLAAGSYLFGGMADRLRRPLLTYGLLEIGIALAAWSMPRLLEAVVRSSLHFQQAGALPGTWLSILRFISAGAVCLPATLLMGGTLPVLVSRLDSGSGIPGNTVGMLYALNAGGGVLGCWLAGFCFIELIGLSGTASLAAALNLIVGLLAWLFDVQNQKAGASQHGQPPVAASLPAPQVGSWLFVIATVTGFTAMLYEIAYTRLLVLVVGSAVHSFSMMVAGILVGITAGGTLSSIAFRRGARPIKLLSWSLIGLGASVLVSVPMTLAAPRIYLWFCAIAKGSWFLFQGFQFLLFLVFLFLPGLFMGVYLPCLVATFGGCAGSGLATGRVYAASTAGNIVGVLVSGLLLIPAFGTRHTLELGILVNVASALAVTRHDSFRGWALPVVAAVVVTSLALAPAWDPAYLTTGFYRLHGVDPEVATRGRKMIYYREDETAVVSVDLWTNGLKSIRINGKADASNGEDMGPQKWVAHLPLLTHPNPRRVLLIGIGSGITAGVSLLYPIQKLDAVEISPAVVEASRFFAADHHDFQADPRTTVAINDARAFVQLKPAGQEPYDVVISQPTNIWISGMSNLVTRDFYRILKSRMRPDGILAQWIQAYGIDAEVLGTVLRTVAVEFPQVRMAVVSGSDVVLLASMKPFGPDFATMRSLFSRPGVAADLASLGTTRPFSVAGLFTVSENDFALFVGEGPVNTDDIPLVEQQAPRAFYLGTRIFLPEHRFKLVSPNSMLTRFSKLHPPDLEDLRDFVRFHRKTSSPTVIRTMLDRLNAMAPGDPRVVRDRAEYEDFAARNHRLSSP